MKTGLQISFKKRSIGGDFLIRAFDKFLKFEPYSFTKNHTTKAWDEKKHRKLITLANENETIIVSGSDYDVFCAVETGTKNPHQSFLITQEMSVFLPNDSEIDSLTVSKDFVVAYLYNADYEEVQSTKFSSNYSQRNFSQSILDTINNTPYIINEFNDKEYDVSFNPGKSDLIDYCWLMAGWKMWFGDPFFEIVSRDLILSFPDAYKIRELDKGRVFVQLFEDIEESSSLKNMEIQMKWRKWLDFEGLIKKYK